MVIIVDVINLDNVVRNICLRKPFDSEILIQDHDANEKVLEEDTPATFDANISAGVANIGTSPIVRIIVLYLPHHALVAIRVEVECEELSICVRIPMPSVRIDKGLNRIGYRSRWVVPSNVVEVEVVDVVLKIIHVEVVKDISDSLSFNRFNFNVKRTRTTNAPKINLFEVWTKGYSFGVAMKCVDVFDTTVAILFQGVSIAINLLHMFGLNAVKCITMA